ncbi:MAG: cytochrome P450 [Legionellaceae bacterium]|nr:cytochrome P450 [Legionellaceae bacterium]
MENYSHLPAGPKGSKLIQTIKFLSRPMAYLEACRERYGKTFTLRFIGQPTMVFISAPHDIKQIFMTTDAEKLGVGGAFVGPIVGDFSLLTLNGKKHLEHRKLILPSLHGERMHVYNHIMATLTQQTISSWQKNKDIILLDEMREITFNVILKTIFGLDEDNARFANLVQCLRSLIKIMKTPLGSAILLILKPLQRNLGPLTPWAKIMKLRQEIDVILFNEIKQRSTSDLTDRIDILSMLLQARDEDGHKLTEEEIRDELMTLLLAGYVTTSNGLTWSLYFILKNKPVLKKIKEEIQQISSEGELLDNIHKLTYMGAAIKEALRITPVNAYASRFVKQPYTMGSYTLSPGTRIVLSIYLAHRESTVWQNPEKYNPERFLNSSEIPYTYFPFGGGDRRCPGAAFALFEIKVALTQILQHTELALHKDYQLNTVLKAIHVIPADGIPVVVKKNDFENNTKILKI